jgi:hypothetical protein
MIRMDISIVLGDLIKLKLHKNTKPKNVKITQIKYNTSIKTETFLTAEAMGDCQLIRQILSK